MVDMVENALQSRSGSLPAKPTGAD